MNKKVGLVGEDPNDTDSIKALLKQIFPDRVSYIHLLKRVRGGELDHSNTRTKLKIECDDKQPDVVVFIRDLDGIITETEKIHARKKWFESFSKDIKAPKLLLLNIYELEALLFAHIEAFNSAYKTDIKGNRDITYIKQPKEELIRHTSKTSKKFSVNDCPNIFEKMHADTVRKRCKYFDDFCKELTMALEVQ